MKRSNKSGFRNNDKLNLRQSTLDNYGPWWKRATELADSMVQANGKSNQETTIQSTSVDTIGVLSQPPSGLVGNKSIANNYQKRKSMPLDCMNFSSSNKRPRVARMQDAAKASSSRDVVNLLNLESDNDHTNIGQPKLTQTPNQDIIFDQTNNFSDEEEEINDLINKSSLHDSKNDFPHNALDALDSIDVRHLMSLNNVSSAELVDRYSTSSNRYKRKY